MLNSIYLKLFYKIKIEISLLYLIEIDYTELRLFIENKTPIISITKTLVVPKEIQIIHRLFLAISMYCRAPSMNH